jgi:hypothetical protein
MNLFSSAHQEAGPRRRKALQTEHHHLRKMSPLLTHMSLAQNISIREKSKLSFYLGERINGKEKERNTKS